MNTTIESAQLLLASILLLCACGSGLLIWGARFSRRGDWLVWLSVAIFAGALGFAGSSWSQSGLKPLSWAHGWIGARGDSGSITFGILQDGTGILLAAVSVLLVGVVIGSRSVLLKEPRPERIFAGACWSLAGMALSWLSLTPWISLIGWVLVLLGGFVALGSGWEDEGESTSAIRFAKERSWALLLTTLGLCGIAAAHSGLEWVEGASWLGKSAGTTMVERLGGALLLIGVFMQFQTFPFQGWSLSMSEANIAVRAVFGCIAPAIVAFAMLYRSEAFLKDLEVFPVFGIIALVSVIFTLMSAGLQGRWRQEFLAWLGSGIAISFAVLAFSGAAVSLSVFLGIVLGGSAMASAATFMVKQRSDKSEPPVASSGGARAWVLGLVFGGVCAATGMAGFVSSEGLGIWIGSRWSEPAEAVAMGGVILAFAFVGWKSAWRLASMKRPVAHGWGTIVAPALLVLASLGVFSTGTLTGSQVLSGSDRVAPALLSRIQQIEEHAGGNAAAAEAAAICFAIAVGACMATYALSRRREPLWQPQTGAGKNTRQFIVSGYRVDHAGAWTVNGLSQVGRAVVKRVDRRAWTHWAGTLASRGLQFVARAGSTLDARITQSIQRAVKVGVEAPGAAFQALQNGDVQWYLLFAIGSSILILLHFLRT